MQYIQKMFVFFGLLFLSVGAIAKPKEKTIKWTTTYVVGEDKSLSAAKKEAAIQAELDALACEFSTYISSTNYSAIRNGETHFSSLNVSQIRGEKIRDLEEPKYEIESIDGMLVIKCTVNFIGREIEKSKTDLDVKVLKNGYTDKYESSTFTHLDELYVSFQAPIDGYLTIFLSDEADNTVTLLPYPKDGIASFRIKHGKKYLFFCDDKKFFMQNPKVESPKNFSNVVGINVSTDKETEMNRIHFVFSPNEYAQPNAHTDGDLNYMSTNSFNAWLAKCRVDSKLEVETVDIIINKKNY